MEAVDFEKLLEAKLEAVYATIESNYKIHTMQQQDIVSRIERSVNWLKWLVGIFLTMLGLLVTILIAILL